MPLYLNIIAFLSALSLVILHEIKLIICKRKYREALSYCMRDQVFSSRQSHLILFNLENSSIRENLVYEENVCTAPFKCAVFCGCSWKTNHMNNHWTHLLSTTRDIHRTLCQNWFTIMWNIYHESKHLRSYAKPKGKNKWQFVM